MSETRRGWTRRRLLGGAAATATLGAVSFAGSRAAERGFDREADLVVVGSGVAAATAAITADELGDRVLMLEKAEHPGGTSARSAGVLWIPNNFALRARGIEDRKAECLAYLARYSYPERYDPAAPHLGVGAREYALLEAFYDNAAAAVDLLRETGTLELAEWRMFALDRPAPDYLDHVPENKVPDGRALGVVIEGGGVGLGAHLMQRLHAAVERRGIPLLLRHRATRLVLDEAGRAIGVEAEHEGGVIAVRARKGIVFATGGYAHAPEYLAAYQVPELAGACAAPTATGDFIAIAGAAGAAMGKLSSAWRTQIVLEEALADRHLASGVFFPPGDSMLQVNRYGRRVVNEKRNYNDRTEVHRVFDPSRAEYPNRVLFMIYDRRTAEAFAGAYPLPAPGAPAPHVLAADTFEALAARLAARLAQIRHRTGGLALDAAFAANLRAAVARFGDFARRGEDADFGRGATRYDREWQAVFSPLREDSGWPANPYPNVTMHPFREEGPYYAIMLGAGALDTAGGPMIDARARVLDARGGPIPGLYGAGNCIASPSRDAYWGAGHTLGLALTFGYIAARAAHEEKGS